MDALQQCAQNYARLCGYAYDCTIARKGHALLLRFLFSPYEFRHLSGLHHLEHPRLEANSERVLKDVLAGKITLLQKKKIHRETGAETLLYRRETYHPE